MQYCTSIARIIALLIINAELQESIARIIALLIMFGASPLEIAQKFPANSCQQVKLDGGLQLKRKRNHKFFNKCKIAKVLQKLLH